MDGSGREDENELKVGFVNENLSGHAAFHAQLVSGLAEVGGLRIETVDIPGRSLLRRALTSPLPLPDGWDFDAPLFRNQVGQSVAVRPQVRRLVDRCDVLHLYTQNACPLTMRYLRRKPYVVTTDSTCAQASEKFGFRYPGRGAAIGNFLSSAVEARVLKGAAEVVAQSEWARKAIVEEVGVDPNRVHCLRLGAPPPWAPIDRPPRRPRIIFVAATMKRKGGWELLRILGDRIGVSVDVVLVTYEQVPARPGLEVRNDIRPGDGQIDQLLASVDIFALPTDMDMSPNAVLEAMAAGLPVVTYRGGALPEMVDDGSSGYVVDSHDERGFGQAITALVESHERRQAFGEAGRRILATRFDGRQASAQFRDILLQVPSRHARRHG